MNDTDRLFMSYLGWDKVFITESPSSQVFIEDKIYPTCPKKQIKQIVVYQLRNDYLGYEITFKEDSGLKNINKPIEATGEVIDALRRETSDILVDEVYKKITIEMRTNEIRKKVKETLGIIEE